MKVKDQTKRSQVNTMVVAEVEVESGTITSNKIREVIHKIPKVIIKPTSLNIVIIVERIIT